MTFYVLLIMRWILRVAIGSEEVVDIMLHSVENSKQAIHVFSFSKSSAYTVNSD